MEPSFWNFGLEVDCSVKGVVLMSKSNNSSFIRSSSLWLTQWYSLSCYNQVDHFRKANLAKFVFSKFERKFLMKWFHSDALNWKVFFRLKNVNFPTLFQVGISNNFFLLIFNSLSSEEFRLSRTKGSQILNHSPCDHICCDSASKIHSLSERWYRNYYKNCPTRELLIGSSYGQIVNRMRQFTVVMRLSGR